MINKSDKQSERFTDEALSKLSPRQRLVLEKWIVGCTPGMIAQILHTPISSIYIILKEIPHDLSPLSEGSDVIQSLDQSQERYTELIDKKFSASLSLDEQAELAWLEERIDEAETPLYDETIKLLKEIRDRLFSDPSRQSGGND